MSTGKLRKINFHHDYHRSNLQTILKDRTNSNSPITRYQRRLLSSDRYQDHSYSPNITRPRSTITEADRTNDKLFHQLSGQLTTIKEAITSLARKSKQKSPKRKHKVITQISVQQDRNKIYQQILKKIQDIKAEKRKSVEIVDEDKTLFYGSDYISGSLFKIKIKLSGSHYRLYCKNRYAKGLLQMKREEYQKINNRMLQGNPCNILKYIAIEDNKLQLKIKSKSTVQGSSTTSVKSYFNYC